MSVLTAQQIHEEILRLSEKVEKLADDLLARGDRLATAEDIWKRMEATVVMAADSVARGEREAIVKHEAEHRAYLEAKYGFDACAKALRAAEAQLSGAQTASGAHRAEANLVGRAR